LQWYYWETPAGLGGCIAKGWGYFQKSVFAIGEKAFEGEDYGGNMDLMSAPLYIFSGMHIHQPTILASFSSRGNRIP
jgi:hypothetical protein